MSCTPPPRACVAFGAWAALAAWGLGRLTAGSHPAAGACVMGLWLGALVGGVLALKCGRPASRVLVAGLAGLLGGLLGGGLGQALFHAWPHPLAWLLGWAST